jgi:hypothetical protein
VKSAKKANTGKENGTEWREVIISGAGWGNGTWMGFWELLALQRSGSHKKVGSWAWGCWALGDGSPPLPAAGGPGGWRFPCAPGHSSDVSIFLRQTSPGSDQPLEHSHSILPVGDNLPKRQHIEYVEKVVDMSWIWKVFESVISIEAEQLAKHYSTAQP